MKLTSIILLTTCLAASAAGFTQTVNLSVKNAPLDKVFEQVKAQTGYSFIWDEKILKDTRQVTLELRNATVQQVMDACTKDQPITYTIIDNLVLIKEKLKSPNESEGHSGQGVIPGHDPESFPPIDIHGRILNEKGEPVIASVQVKGTNKGVTTNDNGEFELKGVDDNATLVISGVSIETFEVKVNGRSELALGAKVKNAIAEEVKVYSTGYQRIPKERATGSFTFIQKEQLDQRIAPDVISKLEGITNGLVFNKKVDGTNDLRIRGESTIWANPNPLIVVNNFVYDGNITDINPNEVDNITILKDASAASIWGVQAANGVIVITTKKGKFNQPLRIELNSNFTIADKPNLFYAPQISSSSYIDFEKYLFNSGYFDASLTDPNLLAVSPIVETLNDLRQGKITSAQAETLEQKYKGYDLRNDFSHYLFKNSKLQQYQINLSGGSNYASYYFAAGFDKNYFSAVGNSDSRVTLNTQMAFKPIKKLDFNMGMTYVDGNVFNNSITNSLPTQNLYPYTKFKDAQGTPIAVPMHRQTFEDTIGNLGFLDWKYFPLTEESLSDNKSHTIDTRFQTSFLYTFVKSLRAEVSYQYERMLVQGSSYLSPNSFFIRNKYNTFAILDANGKYVGSNFNNNLADKGLLDVSSSNLISHHGRASFNFDHSWNKHALVAIAGVELTETKTDGNSNRFWGYDRSTGSYVNPNLFNSYNTYPNLSTSQIDNPGAGVSNFGTLGRFRSYFGILNYVYNGRYTISGSSRFDGTNYFGVKTNQKTVPLWSAGLKWDINKENFYQSQILPKLAVRLTYGFNGNLDRNIAAITTIAYSGSTAIYSGLNYSSINNIPNPSLRWEKTGQFNAGIDFGFMNDRVGGSVEYYRKNGVDLLGDAPIDITTGVSRIRGNFSGLKTSGVDFQLNTIPVNKALKWNLNVIFNYTSDKVTKYDVPQGTLSYLISYNDIYPIVGSPLYSLYSFRWAGLDPVSGDPRVYLSDTISKNYNSSASFKPSDLIYSGRYNPPITGSVYSCVSWKNFSLAFNLTYKLGYYFRRSSIDYSKFVNGYLSLNSDFDNRWLKAGDEKYTNVPSLTYPLNSARDNFYTGSTVLIEKGDHIRLQFINLSYDIKRALLKKIGFQSAKIYFYANNIGILWRANQKGIDPDYPYVSYPPSRTYSFGVKFSL